MDGKCIKYLYPISKDLWVGTQNDGGVKQFKNIPEYNKFLADLASAGHVCPNITTYPPSALKDYKTPFTGFLELKPLDSKDQVKYSAMSPYWLGIDATNKALETGEYDSDWTKYVNISMRR